MAIGNPEPQNLDWISAPMLRRQLGRSAKTLQRLRAEEWPEGIVWRYVNSRTVIYNIAGVRAWCQGQDQFNAWLRRTEKELAKAS